MLGSKEGELVGNIEGIDGRAVGDNVGTDENSQLVVVSKRIVQGRLTKFDEPGGWYPIKHPDG